MTEYTPTVEEVRENYADYASENCVRRRGTCDHHAEFDRMIAQVERAAAVKALREAAFTGYFGTSAQSTLLRMAERLEADRIESGESA